MDFTTTFSFDMSTNTDDPNDDAAYGDLVDGVVKLLFELREKHPGKKFSCDHCPWIIGGESELL
ncbi:MAG: hypothetical protein GY841_16425 [FCB group bacterium]|nr:hypothetical protein [FCB group bacterium]